MAEAKLSFREEILKNNLEAFLPYICECVKATDLLVHLHYFTKEQRKTIFKTHRSNEVAATRKALEILLTETKDQGRFTAIRYAIEMSEYPKIIQMLDGENFSCDQNCQKIIDVFGNEIIRRLNSEELLPMLVSQGTLTPNDAEEVRAERRTYGETRACWVLLFLLPNRVENWFSNFFEALLENGYDDIAEILDPDLFKKITELKKEDDTRRNVGIVLEESYEDNTLAPGNFATDIRASPDFDLDSLMPAGQMDSHLSTYKSKPPSFKKEDINLNLTEKKSTKVSSQSKKFKYGKISLSEEGEQSLSRTDSQSKDAKNLCSRSNRKKVTTDSDQKHTNLKYENTGTKEKNSLSQTNRIEKHSTLTANGKGKTDLTTKSVGKGNTSKQGKQLRSANENESAKETENKDNVPDLAKEESLGVVDLETITGTKNENNVILLFDEQNKNPTVIYERQPGNKRNSGLGRVPATQCQKRQAWKEEDDSPGLSESNESYQRRQRSIGNKEGDHVDTLDTSDIGNSGKQRQKRSKMKSSSCSALFEINQNLNGNVTNAPSNNARVSNSYHKSSSHVNMPPPAVDMQQSLDSIIPRTQKMQSLQKTGNLSSSPSSPRVQTLNQNSSVGDVLVGASCVSQNDRAINGISSLQESNGKPSGLSTQERFSFHCSTCSKPVQIKESESVTLKRRGDVVYHLAMIQLFMPDEVERFMQDADKEEKLSLLENISTLREKMKMLKESKMQKLDVYQSILASCKINAFEETKKDKTLKDKKKLSQLANDIAEITRQFVFVELCKNHLRMLITKLRGIEVCYMYSIAVCAPGEPLQLQPRTRNPLLQFQTQKESCTRCDIKTLHAGTPDGLMACLFASNALRDGYIHQFLFCYRYFTTATDLMTFLKNRYASAIKSGSTDKNITRFKTRTIDFLHYWLEDYYSIDFEENEELMKLLQVFIEEQINHKRFQSLHALLCKCTSGNNVELCLANPDKPQEHFWQARIPKDKRKQFPFIGKPHSKDEAGKVTMSPVRLLRRHRTLNVQWTRKTRTFSLADYTPQRLAEQLCLIEQGIFHLTHPVHYLDSKSYGVGVALTMKGLKTPAMAMKDVTEKSHGLFIEPLHGRTTIKKMINHALDLSHWVSGEIMACCESKTQIELLSKFLFIAHACVELRNFATSMAILDGIENSFVKLLPAWKCLPQKCTAIIDELRAIRVFLKEDPLSLMQYGKDDYHMFPTIPSVVIFLLHIQQLEMKEFRLVNQMYKWGNMRSICQGIDQIRIFQEYMYGFDADHLLQNALRRRIHKMSDQDLHDLASHHGINYQNMSSGSRIARFFKKKWENNMS